MLFAKFILLIFISNSSIVDFVIEKQGSNVYASVFPVRIWGLHSDFLG